MLTLMVIIRFELRERKEYNLILELSYQIKRQIRSFYMFVDKRYVITIFV